MEDLGKKLYTIGSNKLALGWEAFIFFAAATAVTIVKNYIDWSVLAGEAGGIIEHLPNFMIWASSVIGICYLAKLLVNEITVYENGFTVKRVFSKKTAFNSQIDRFEWSRYTYKYSVTVIAADGAKIPKIIIDSGNFQNFRKKLRALEESLGI
jgi:hypothetical protein